MFTLKERMCWPVSTEKHRSCRLRDAMNKCLESMLKVRAVTGSVSCGKKGRKRRLETGESRRGGLNYKLIKGQVEGN